MIETNVMKVQMAYFFKDDSSFKSFDLISLLYNEFKDSFKSEPQILSTPVDAPKEIPRFMWKYENKTIMFSGLRIDISLGVPSGVDWILVTKDFSSKIESVIEKFNIQIDRVGIITENSINDNVTNLLDKHIKINSFNKAEEKNISWLERKDIFNKWTNIYINEQKHETNVMFDINSFPEIKLTSIHTNFKSTMNKAIDEMKGMIENVWYFNK